MGERLVATIKTADKRLLLLMRQHVCRQVSLAAEQTVAFLACEWFLARVKPHVSAQISALSKPLETEIALERLITNVGPYVHIKMGRLVELFEAVRTLLRLSPPLTLFILSAIFLMVGFAYRFLYTAYQAHRLRQHTMQIILCCHDTTIGGLLNSMLVTIFAGLDHKHQLVDFSGS